MGETWLPAVEGHFGRSVTVRASRPLAGGYVSGDVWSLDLLVAGEPVAVIWKRSSAREVAALRAVAAVPGLGGSSLLADGGVDGGVDGESPWVLLERHPGTPLVPGDPVPGPVYDVLARVHAWYLDRRPLGLPVVDAAFWRRLCLESALPAVRGAAARAGHPAYPRADAALLAWAVDERMVAALTTLPATLAHGDLHRGNILATADRATIIDWGNARIAPGGLDLAVLAEQGGVDEQRYRRTLAELCGGPVDPALIEVERQWALAMGYVQYLTFAADHLGGDRVGEMVDRAAAAFERLGPALARL